jgi:hypothetical protein
MKMEEFLENPNALDVISTLDGVRLWVEVIRRLIRERAEGSATAFLADPINANALTLTIMVEGVPIEYAVLLIAFAAIMETDGLPSISREE